MHVVMPLGAVLSEDRAVYVCLQLLVPLTTSASAFWASGAVWAVGDGTFAAPLNA